MKEEKVCIVGFIAKNEGVFLETNIPARLKPNRMPSKTTFEIGRASCRERV